MKEAFLKGDFDELKKLIKEHQKNEEEMGEKFFHQICMEEEISLEFFKVIKKKKNKLKKKKKKDFLL